MTEKTDTLFIGGALYAYGLDSHLKKYLAGLDGSMVGRAVVFSTSWISKHALDLIRSALEAKGIPVEKETFYCKSKQVDASLDAAGSFGKKYAE